MAGNFSGSGTQSQTSPESEADADFSLNGVETIEIQDNWTKFLEMPVGIIPARVKEASAAGFYLVLRPLNVSHPDKAVVDEFLRAVDASDKVSAVLFVGKEAFGYKEQAAYFRDAMAARHIPIVLIEAQSQLGFENQAGALDMVKSSDYNTIRLYAMAQNELIQLTPEEASARFYISDIERNIRMNLFLLINMRWKERIWMKPMLFILP